MVQPTEQDRRDPPRLLDHAVVRVAFAIEAAAISEFAAAVVPTTSDADAQPGEIITQARQLRKFTAELMIWAVLLERAKGRSWRQIAAASGYTETYIRATYGPVEKEWLNDLNSSGTSRTANARTLEEALLLPQRDVPTSEDDVRKAAELLDEWCIRHRSAHSLPTLDPTLRPVTNGIVER